MSRNDVDADAKVSRADPYLSLTAVVADAADAGETFTHSEDPPVVVAADDQDADLFALIVDDELVTTFRADARFCQSTLDLGVWIDRVAAWWTAEEEPEPPGFDRGGSAFR